MKFQQRVCIWMQACFQTSALHDVQERGDRVLEEVLELLQSGGYDRSRVAALTDYVFNRPLGSPGQEMGGVMVTLAAYATAVNLDMDMCAEAELRAIWGRIEAIRAKQESKQSIHFPIPGNPPMPEVRVRARLIGRPVAEPSTPLPVHSVERDVDGVLLVHVNLSQALQPEGGGTLPIEVFDTVRAALASSRDSFSEAAQFHHDMAITSGELSSTINEAIDAIDGLDVPKEGETVESPVECPLVITLNSANALVISGKCNACGSAFSMDNLHCDDGCPCNSPRGVNLQPMPCVACKSTGCIKPGHRISLLLRR